MKNKPLLLAFLLIALTFLFIALISFKKTLDQKSNLKVTTTIYPLYSLTEEISQGTNIEIELILPPGTSPHDFEPSVKDTEKINGSDLIFMIGHGLDDWAKDITQSVSPDSQLITVDKDIYLLENNLDEDDHSQFDPHYWNSIGNMILIANQIQAELIKIDPKNESLYKKNFADLESKYLDKLVELQTKLEGLEKNKIITFHNAFAYMAHEFEFEIIAVLEEYPGKEPSPQYIAGVGKKIKSFNLTTVFKEPQFSDSIVLSLAQDYNIKVETLDPEGGKIEGESFIETYEKNFNNIYESLK